MSEGLQTDQVSQTSFRPGRNVALRVKLASGIYSVPLSRLHHLAGYATLAGEPKDYFLGWLQMRGEYVPVFDLNRLVCDEPTPANFGSRVLVVRAEGHSHLHVGLLAAGATDTINSETESVEELDLNAYLPMLYSFIPDAPDDHLDRA